MGQKICNKELQKAIRIRNENLIVYKAIDNELAGIWQKNLSLTILIFDHKRNQKFCSDLQVDEERKQKLLRISQELMDGKFPDLDELIEKAEQTIMDGS